jgi:hypothetical protein
MIKSKSTLTKLNRPKSTVGSQTNRSAFYFLYSIVVLLILNDGRHGPRYYQSLPAAFS